MLFRVKLKKAARSRSVVRVGFMLFCLASLSRSLLSQDILIDVGDDWQFFRGTVAPSDPPTDWRSSGFDAAAWEVGPTGIGYGDADDATVLDDMRNSYISVFARRSFNVADAGAVGNFVLYIDYDDGFIAYVNGIEAARSNIGNAGEETLFDATADGNHEAGIGEFFLLDAATLTDGVNVLAIEIHNTTLASSDLSLVPRLSTDDPRVDCPTNLVCSTSLDGVSLSWTSPLPYDSIRITADGAEVPGSPLAGDQTSFVDASPDLGATYAVIAMIDGVECPALTCTTPAEIVILADDEEWRYFKGTEAPSDPIANWRAEAFDDSGWLLGFTGIGYADNDDATILDDMEDNYASIFCRKVFTVPSLDQIDRLALRIDYDDGFIAFLNGVEVARTMGAQGEEFAFNQLSPAGHEANGDEDFDLTSQLGLLQEGDNVLAIQVHNTALGSSDLSFIPSLVVNACARLSGMACALDVDTGDVLVSWAASSEVDSYAITRNGQEMPGSPFAGDILSVVDSDPGNFDVVYSVTPTVAGVDCPSASCTFECQDRLLVDGVTCTLSLVDGFTQAELSWSAQPGATDIEVRREGDLLAILSSDATNYTDPDVESDQPENDTEFTVTYRFESGDTCTISCAPVSLCPENFACVAVDDGGVDRPQLSWDNIVKNWDSFSVLRDGAVIATLDGTTNSYFDTEVIIEFGVSYSYDVVPVAPVGSEVGGCDMSCTIGGAIIELGAYDAPAGGWDYFVEFSDLDEVEYNATAGEAGNLDGNWIRSLDLDTWDGSGPEEFGAAPAGLAPGGIDLYDDGEAACGESLDVLRILDPGNTSNPAGIFADAFPDAFDLPNNDSILLAIDTGVSDRNLLRSGVTFTARWRVHPDSPEYLNAQATGDGAPLDTGVGQIGFYYRDSDAAQAEGATAGLAFTLQSGDQMQMSTAPVTTLAAAQITSFRSIWVTIEDPEGDETYNIDVYLNGSESTFATYTLTDASLQGGTADFGETLGNYLAIGTVDAGQDSDIEIDFVGYKEGVHPPTVTACVPSDNNRPTARIVVSPGTSVELEGGSATVNLDGASSDDGDGGAQGLAYRWTKLSGPSGETIANSTASSTDVTLTLAGTYRFQVRVDDGEAAFNTDTESVEITVTGGPVGDGLFRRGDADSSGVTNITDGIFVLNFLFLGGPTPGCLDAADADDSGVVNITDGIFILNFLFLGGATPPSPAPVGPCGPDPSADTTECLQNHPCA